MRMNRCAVAGLFWALVLVGIAPHALAAALVSGPMAGPPAMRSATLWLQLDGPGRVEITFWEAMKRERQRRITTFARAADDFTVIVEIEELSPGTRYRYQVAVDGRQQVVASSASFATQALWHWRSEPPDVTFAAGSCTFLNEPDFDRPGKPYGGGEQVFDAIASARPDLMLWLGDNLYFREVDYTAAPDLGYRYRYSRRQPALQNLLSATHHAAIWDDHDYGRNNANRSFVYKEQSLELFQRYWPNPSAGLREAPGVFTTFSLADLDFFLLDDRWYRDADHDVRLDKSLYGAAQLAWLRAALLASTATFKVIAGGSQFWNDDNKGEGWNQFRLERGQFEDWLAESGVQGVLFMSGDRHMSMLLRRQRPGLYPLYELTCSPLTSGARKVAGLKPPRDLVAGTWVGERNFCLVEVSGPRARRSLDLAVHDVNGEQIWSHSLDIDDLSTDAD